MLAYLGFASKNLALEYQLMSEHAARAVYLVYFAGLLYFVNRGGRLWIAGLLAMVALFAVQIKPSGAVLVPVTLALYAYLLLRDRTRLRTLAWHGAVFCAVFAIGHVAYSALYQHRYGVFGLSAYSGHNQFSHVGHLVVLDSSSYPEIKRELKKFMPLYKAKYANRGDYHPNWLIYGSTDDALKADFGTRSPSSVILSYAQSRSRPDLPVYL